MKITNKPLFILICVFIFLLILSIYSYNPYYYTSKHAYKDPNFSKNAIEKGIFTERHPELINKYIPLNNSINYVYSSIMKSYKESQNYDIPTALCSLYQLGFDNFDRKDLSDLKEEVINNPWLEYSHLAVLSLIGYPIEEKLINQTIKNIEEELIIEVNKNNILNTKLKLYEYLYSSTMFNIKPDETIVVNILDIVYPKRKIKSNEKLTYELILDLYNAKLLSLNFDKNKTLIFDQDKIIKILDESWVNGSYFHVEDCNSFCDLKSIHSITLIDLMHDFVPDKYLINITSYLLSRFKEDGSIKVMGNNINTNDILLSGTRCNAFCILKSIHSITFIDLMNIKHYLFSVTRCNDFCEVYYWQIIFDLNHLLPKLNKYEERINNTAANFREESFY